MCVFCAAVPATLAVGVAVRGEQRDKQQAAEARGEPMTRPAVPAGPVTALLLACIVTAAVVYHTQVSG